MKQAISLLLALALVLSLGLVTGLPVMAGSTTWYVDAGVDESGDGTSPEEAFKTIAEALNVTSAEETIMVATGTYVEQLIIDTSLTLKAGSKPVLDFSDRDALGLEKTDGAIEVSAPDVTIEGFEIIGYDMTDEDWGDQRSTATFPTIKALAGADGLVVVNNDFVVNEGAANAALLIVGPTWDGETAQDIAFVGNTVTGYSGGVTGRGKKTHDLRVEGNTFDIPLLEGIGLHPTTGKDEGIGIGVQLWHGDNLQVFDNAFTGSFDEAAGDYEEEGSLCNHYAVVSWTTWFIGVYDWPETDGTMYVEDNEMTNLYLGIGSLAAGGGGEITGNTIDANHIGIQLGQVSDVYATAPAEGLAITENDITNNVIGIWVQDFVEDGIHASYNNIFGNTQCGVQNVHPEDAAFDARYNWWGHETGPDHDGLNLGGQGDAVSDDVHIGPWLYRPQEHFVPGAPCYAGSVLLANEATEVEAGSWEGGWNSFSTPITLDSSANTASELLELSDLFIVRAQRFDPDAQKWVEIIMGHQLVDEDYTIRPGEGFYIQVQTAGSIPILVRTGSTWPPRRDLVAGWNLVGMSSLKAEAVTTALSGVDYSFVLSAKPPNAEAWSVPPDEAGERSLHLGEAYWVAMGEPGILYGITTTPVQDDMTWDLNQLDE